jgi:hypothetical protein
MLRGLNDKYHHCIATITSKQPPHDFLSARSFLLLEELYATQHGKMAAQQAMVAQASHIFTEVPKGFPRIDTLHVEMTVNTQVSLFDALHDL